MHRSILLAAVAALSISSAASAQTGSTSVAPPPPSLNGQPPAIEIPRQPTPIPPLRGPVAGVEPRPGTVFDCERLAAARQPLPLDCRRSFGK